MGIFWNRMRYHKVFSEINMMHAMEVSTTDTCVAKLLWDNGNDPNDTKSQWDTYVAKWNIWPHDESNTLNITILNFWFQLDYIRSNITNQFEALISISYFSDMSNLNVWYQWFDLGLSQIQLLGNINRANTIVSNSLWPRCPYDVARWWVKPVHMHIE